MSSTILLSHLIIKRIELLVLSFSFNDLCLLLDLFVHLFKHPLSATHIMERWLVGNDDY